MAVLKRNACTRDSAPVVRLLLLLVFGFALPACTVGEVPDDGKIQLPFIEYGARGIFGAGLQYHEHALLAFR